MQAPGWPVPRACLVLLWPLGLLSVGFLLGLVVGFRLTRTGCVGKMFQSHCGTFVSKSAGFPWCIFGLCVVSPPKVFAQWLGFLVLGFLLWGQCFGLEKQRFGLMPLRWSNHTIKVTEPNKGKKMAIIVFLLVKTSLRIP